MRVLYETFLLIIVFALAFLMFNNTSLSGDAAVYFTFFKHFFELPFSYQPHTVSFGATSPLHVFITAIIYYIFQDNWFLFSKLFQYILIAFSAYILNKSIKGNLYNLLIIILLILINRPLLSFSIQLYETGLAFFAVSILYYYIKSGANEKAIIFSGFLYLVRPEMFLISVSLFVYLLVKYRSYKKYILLFIISLLPAIVFHLYMYIYTGEILPSNVSARVINALEDNNTWFNNVKASLNTLINKDGYIYFIGILTVISIIIRNRFSKYIEEFIIVIPTIIPYVILAPTIYSTRYLLLGTPILIVLAEVEITSLIDKIIKWLTNVSEFFQKYLNNIVYPVLSMVIILLILFMYSQYLTNPKIPRDDFDVVLLKDLAQRLNAIQDRRHEQKILIYEIQGQFFINSFCYSLDGIVGKQIHRVLLKKASEFDLIRKEKINYIVTSNSFNYRKIYSSTLFEKLFIHDLNSHAGDSIIINNMCFTKLFSNPFFENPKFFKLKHARNGNCAEFVRVYNDSIPRWGNKNFFWNSVYSVNY
jgi:hypothetical protein